MEINQISELMMFSLPNNTMKKDKIKIHCYEKLEVENVFAQESKKVCISLSHVILLL